MTVVSLANATLTLSDDRTVKISSADFAIKSADYYKVNVANIVTKLRIALDTTATTNTEVSNIQNANDITLTKPTALAYSKDTNDGIVLTFDEQLDKAAAENKANYTLPTLTAGSKIDSAVYVWDATNKKATVTLTLSSDATKLSGTTSVELNDKVVDLSGNALAVPDRGITGIVVSDGAKPTVSADSGITTTALDNDTITVTFNKAVRAADAINGDNYTITLADGTSFKASDLIGSKTDLSYDGSTNTVTILLDNSRTTS